jgi:hypothetical protein
MSFPALDGAPGVSGITAAAELGAITTNTSVLDSDPSGFWICTVRFPADCRSAAASDVVHCVLEGQDVVRDEAATRIEDPGPGVDGAKLFPDTSRVKPPAAAAYALVGASEEMLGPPEIVTTAVADCVVSSALVATMSITSGEGADAGAVYSPVESMDPHAPATAQPAPAMDHVTCWFAVPVTVAVNRCRPPPAIVALPGRTLTTTCGRIVMLAETLALPLAWLVAVIETGLGDGTPAGAR